MLAAFKNVLNERCIKFLFTFAAGGFDAFDIVSESDTFRKF